MGQDLEPDWKAEEGQNSSLLMRGGKMNKLAIVWSIFTLLFACLCVAHLFASRRSIAKFKAEEIEYRKVDTTFVTETTDVDLNKPLKKFVQDFNGYIEGFNRSSFWQNILAACGYFLAAATAFISFCIEIRWYWWEGLSFG
jgi:hypothetical protein